MPPVARHRRQQGRVDERHAMDADEVMGAAFCDGVHPRHNLVFGQQSVKQHDILAPPPLFAPLNDGHAKRRTPEQLLHAAAMKVGFVFPYQVGDFFQTIILPDDVRHNLEAAVPVLFPVFLKEIGKILNAVFVVAEQRDAFKFAALRRNQQHVGVVYEQPVFFW